MLVAVRGKLLYYDSKGQVKVPLSDGYFISGTYEWLNLHIYVIHSVQLYVGARCNM